MLCYKYIYLSIDTYSYQLILSFSFFLCQNDVATPKPTSLPTPYPTPYPTPLPTFTPTRLPTPYPTPYPPTQYPTQYPKPKIYPEPYYSLPEQTYPVVHQDSEYVYHEQGVWQPEQPYHPPPPPKTYPVVYQEPKPVYQEGMWQPEQPYNPPPPPPKTYPVVYQQEPVSENFDPILNNDPYYNEDPYQPYDTESAHSESRQQHHDDPDVIPYVRTVNQNYVRTTPNNQN